MQSQLTLPQLASKAARMSMPDSIVYYASLALQIPPAQGEQKDRLQAFYLLAKGYNASSEYDKALKVLESATSLADSLQDQTLSRLCMLEAGKSFQLKNELARALELYLEAYKGFEADGDFENLTRANIYLAEYYRNLGKLKEAETHIRQAFALVKDYSVGKRIQIYLYNRAAAIKSETRDGDSSLYFSRLALGLSRELGDQGLQAVSLNEIAYIYEATSRFIEAIDYYKQAENIWRLYGAKREWANVYSNLARVYSRLGQRGTSTSMMLQLADTARKYGWLANLKDTYTLLAENYRLDGDSARWKDYRFYAAQTVQELYVKEHQAQLEEINARYESDKKEKEIAQANLKIQEQEKDHLILVYSLWVLAGALVVIGLVSRQKVRANRLLQSKSEEIAETNKKLSAALNQSELLMREMHHRVKNNLQIISSMLHLQADSVEDARIKEILADNDNRILSMAYLHEKLYQQNNLEFINGKEYLSEVIDNVIYTFHSSASQIKFRKELKEVTLSTRKAVITGLIVNELVTNSIKHAFSKGDRDREIAIQAEPAGDKLHIRISDNGKGLAANFDPDKSASFGLRLIQILVKQLEGTMTIRTESGVRFDFEI